MAPQHAHSRAAGQILQHTAIVLAGMASIGLTVAAGTYIVHQIGDTGSPAVIHSGRPDTVSPPALEPDRSEADAPNTAPTTVSWGLTAESWPLPIVLAAPTPTAAVTTVRPSDVGGRLKLSDNTYVGANLSRTQQHSLTVRLDTNLPAAFGATESPETEPAEPPAGVTEFRTDLDVRSGEFSVAMTDPLLGRHDMRAQRHTQPAAVESDHPQQLPNSAQA